MIVIVGKLLIVITFLPSGEGGPLAVDEGNYKITLLITYTMLYCFYEVRK